MSFYFQIGVLFLTLVLRKWILPLVCKPNVRHTTIDLMMLMLVCTSSIDTNFNLLLTAIRCYPHPTLRKIISHEREYF